ncbi:hypothetical protein ACN28S_07415 [Cystobacter fuscus]
MREGAWGLLLGAWLCACGEGDGGGGGALPVDSPGPWSQEAVLDYSKQFAVGTPQSVGLDAGGNLWLLDGARVGVLRPGDSQPTWTSGVGQAGRGFRSSVVCGGAAGRAYVGYLAEELARPRRDDLDDPVFLEGDLDVVRLRPDGGVELEQHLVIRNTNDPHYDEDRSVLTCVRVARGPFRGELYLGTNHGVTRVRGLDYNAHRHPVFKNASGSLRIGYTYAVGLAQDGDVLVGNEWKVGIVTPPAALGDWDDLAKVPWKLDTYVEALGSQEDMDLWRGFVQTKDGAYWLGSAKYGVWRLTPLRAPTSGSRACPPSASEHSPPLRTARCWWAPRTAACGVARRTVRSRAWRASRVSACCNWWWTTACVPRWCSRSPSRGSRCCA